MKKIFTLMAIAATVLMAVSCGSSKNVATTTTTAPADLSKYESGLFDYGYAKSYNKGKAYTDALRNAQQNIATRLYRVISAVDSDFGQETENGANMQSLSERSARFVGIIDDKVATVRLAGEPKFTKTADGVFECEVEVIMDNSLVAEVQAELTKASMSDDEVVRVKFEENKFKQEYEKELEAFRNRKNQ